MRRLGGSDADVLPLHGRLTPGEQDLALTAGPRRRVVVSTAVAESSLTVPGVRAVVDAGLSREPRTDHRRGLAGLVTVGVSRAAAEQRAGRAGREAPGAVYRCWSQAEHAHLAAHPQPEIATADLTSFALELAAWGSPDGAGLALLDPPPEAAMAAARATLADARGRGARTARSPTAAGRSPGSRPTPGWPARCSTGPPWSAPAAPPRSSRCSPRTCARPAATWSPRCGPLRRGGPAAAGWPSSVRQLRGALPAAVRAARGERGLPDDLAVGLVVALAHPDGSPGCGPARRRT